MNNYRYERKFVIYNSLFSEIVLSIKNNPYNFSEIYEERNVNNIYYDTPQLSNYYDNINGNSVRKKLRIRWYGKFIGKISSPKFEIKSKIGNLGTKQHFQLNSFTFQPGCNVKTIRNCTINSELLQLINLEGFNPILVNSYRRRYFQSFDKKFRITIDTALSFYPIQGFLISLLGKHLINNCVILELKYITNNDKYANLVTNHFPFRMTKCSKYVLGIDHLLF